ncbi:MAG: DUF5654 family protein [Candidatus Aenigmatarchaeota archaeon]
MMVKKDSHNSPAKYKSPVGWRQQRRNIILNNEMTKFTRAFKENFITLIISAMGLVAALSWNDAIKSAIAALFPTESDVVYKFYVAVSVTIMAVVITYFLSRIKTNGKA